MRKILSFLAAILFAGSMMADSFAPKALADITADDVVIVTMQNANGVYAMSNDKGTSNPPTAVAVTVTDGKISTDATNILWTVEKDGENLSFKTGDKYLYCTNSNNGVRVGANAGTFIISSDYLCCTSTSSNRFIGVYNSADWRCYTTINSNITGQTLTFYAKETEQGGGDDPEPDPDPQPQMKTVYCKMAYDWWTVDNAAIGIYTWNDNSDPKAAWPGERMTLVENETDVYSFELDINTYHMCIFTRVNGEGEIADWGAKTGDLIIPTDDNDLFTITSELPVWGDPGVVGVWSVYGEGGGDTPEPEPENHTYTVAGEPAAVFGEATWNPSVEANDMALVEGLYKWEKTEIAFAAAGNVLFKVVTDHDWANASYPADNFELAIAEAGIYTITITFDTEGNVVTGVATKTGDVEPDPQPEPSVESIILKFNGTGESEKDNSQAFAADVAAIFDAASQAYVASVETATKVYAGRPIADDNSCVKFGTSSAAGTLEFTLAQAIEVDSIIVNATQYSATAAEITINGTKFDLTAGNKVPQDCKITPEGEVSTISIVQSGSQRIYLRNVRIYPKAQGGGEEPEPQPEPQMKTIYCKMAYDWWTVDNAAIGIYTWDDNSTNKAAWPGERMTLVEGETDVWSFDLDINTYHMCIFTRVNGEGEIADWGAKTGDLIIPTDDNDLFTITSELPVWGDPGVEGTWSVYGEGGGEDPEPQPVDNWAEIVWTEPVEKADLAEEVTFNLLGSEFSATIHDAGDKMAIDESYCRFGTAEGYKMYSHRLKSGGASSSTKNYITLNIPSAGKLRIAPRTGSNSATDRALVITQGENELYNAIVQESQAVKVDEGEPAQEVSVYPYVTVDVAAGEVRVSYTAGLNFYAFAFEASAEPQPQPAEGYYIVGTMNNWTPTADDAYKFVANPDNEGEYVLHYTLAADDVFKVVEIASNSWYPGEGGEASNYIVDAAHAGEKDIYFRPDYLGGEGWWYGCIYVAENVAPTGAPTAAPAEPTYAGYQVRAAYSAKYEADCNFGDWGSGTQYTQEEFGKKYVTTDLGYFGLEFTGMDCSEMEALHLDVWIAADAQFNVYPIWGHQPEQAKLIQLVGGQWNSIDIPLTDYDLITDWTNIYQIKIDQASNLTFWLNNVYFYTTQTKTVDLEDGYYLMGSMNNWDIHDMTAAQKFAVNPDNDGEYKLTYTLAAGNEFKVVEVANNALTGNWYPSGDNNNYIVDFAHTGERDIYFRPDGLGGEDWHYGYIYVVKDPNANPWTTWFATGESWETETESYLDWDAENHKATIHIMIDKNGQWRAQAKYPGLVAELGKCYHVALKLKANNAINNVTIKYQDNAEMIYVTDAALEANVEYVFDQTVAGANQESGAPGNGIMVLDFGFSHAGDIIEIYDVVIEEVECPQPTHTYTVAGSSAALFGESWAPAKVENDMIKQEDGTYKWENSEVELGAGDVEFKVVIDHDWANGSYPEQNYILNIAEDGIYTVTITYNPADNNAVNAVATKTGDAVVVKHYLVVGQPIIANGEEWNNAADINEMTSADEGATYTLTIADLQLMAGTKYRYKIVEKGEWTEYFPKHEDNSDTCFTVPTNGVYTITYVYTVATELCEVQTLRTGDLPEPEHTNGYYLMGTFSGVDAWTLDDLTEAKRFLPIETTAEGTRYALEVSLAAGDSIKFVNVVQDAIVLWMPEGTNKGFVIDANHAGEKTIYLTVYTNGDWFYYIEQNLPDGYYLLGSMNNWTAAAEYRFVPAETTGEYILNATVEAGDEIKVAYVVNAHATEWYPGEGEPNYLVDVAHAGTKDIYFRTEYNLDWYEFGGYFWMGDNGGATSIDNTAADAKAVKLIQNGMILIIKGDKTYNIMGQIVK